jgi:hypothetical protein
MTRDADAKLSGNGSRPESRTVPGRSSTWTCSGQLASFASSWRVLHWRRRVGDDDLKATIIARVHELGRSVRGTYGRCTVQWNACTVRSDRGQVCDVFGLVDTAKKKKVPTWVEHLEAARERACVHESNAMIADRIDAKATQRSTPAGRELQIDRPPLAGSE